MRIRKQQSGFAVLELILVVIIVAAIVVAGLWVYNRNKSTNETASTTPINSTESPVAHNVSSAPAIHSTGDLDKALATLNQNNPDTANISDQSQLDSRTSF